MVVYEGFKNKHTDDLCPAYSVSSSNMIHGKYVLFFLEGYKCNVNIRIIIKIKFKSKVKYAWVSEEQSQIKT